MKAGEWATLESIDGQGRSLILRFIAGRSIGISAKGQLRWEGKPFTPKPNPDIFLVPEEPRIFEGLSVAQNLFVQDGPSFLPVRALTIEASKILNQLPVTIPLAEDARFLSETERFWLEMARLILRPRKLLLIDEVPRGLSETERQSCAEFLNRLQSAGLSILDTSRLSPQAKLIPLEKLPEVMDENFRRHGFLESATGREALLSIQRNEPKESFEIQKGEIVGFLGSKNSGRRELWDELLRFRNLQKSALDFEISSGQKNPRIGFVSGFRSATGLFEGRSSIFNLCFPRPNRRRKSLDLFKHYTELLRLENRDPRARIESLSREDRQKVLLARALKDSPEIICVEEITRGLEMETRYQVFQIIRQLADSGVSVLVLSWNLREMIRICDRVIWLKRNRPSETWEGQPQVIQSWEQQSSYRGIS